MFQNNSQLNAAMKEILNIFRQSDDISILYPKYEGIELDMVEAVNTCLSRGYLTGVSCTVGAQDDVIINVFAPHVTTSGMEFISES